MARPERQAADRSLKPHRPRIAVFAGPTATIQNTPPLVTAATVRSRLGFPPSLDPSGRVVDRDALRPQRLAAPVTVYIEQFSAHPLERDAEALYAEADGYIGHDGQFRKDRVGDSDKPVYSVELHPEDGLYLLPFAGRQRTGDPWECTESPVDPPAEKVRQTFVPDASRIYEEIDRFQLGHDGFPSLLSREADFDFFRTMPSGGWTKRHDASGDAEQAGVDFFAYQPESLRGDPYRALLAATVNRIQETLDSGNYDGAQWLEGSPSVDESLYWFGLLIDTVLPIVGHSAQRAHGTLSADGPHNIFNGVRYIASRAWANEQSVDQVGPVLIVDELAFFARDVAKVDGRPGGYEATGGHGGIVADLGGAGPPEVTYVPRRRFTHRSDVRLSVLPTRVHGVRLTDGKICTVPIRVTGEHRRLLHEAVPKVTIETYARYAADSPGGDPDQEPGILAWTARHLRDNPLAGFVVAGAPPYGNTTLPAEAALRIAVFSGFPVVRCGRGNPGGRAWPLLPDFIVGNNLTPVKARLLLMAALLKLGAMPPARDPRQPTGEEMERVRAKVADYQAVFDTH